MRKKPDRMVDIPEEVIRQLLALPDRYREVLGFWTGDSETYASWCEFFSWLKGIQRAGSSADNSNAMENPNTVPPSHTDRTGKIEVTNRYS